MGRWGREIEKRRKKLEPYHCRNVPQWASFYELKIPKSYGSMSELIILVKIFLCMKKEDYYTGKLTAK